MGMNKVLFAFLCALSAQVHAEIIRCRWEPQARAMTYLVYNSRSKSAYTVSGYNDPNCLRTGGRYSDSSGHVSRHTRGRYATTYEHQCRRNYSGVEIRSGLPPYGRQGISLVAFGGDIAMAHMRFDGSGTNWYERDTWYPYQSYFGSNFPGNPDAGSGWATQGVCWTKRVPPRRLRGDSRYGG
jgi:hypothetical protein